MFEKNNNMRYKGQSMVWRLNTLRYVVDATWISEKDKVEAQKVRETWAQFKAKAEDKFKGKNISSSQEQVELKQAVVKKGIGLINLIKVNEMEYLSLILASNMARKVT